MNDQLFAPVEVLRTRTRKQCQEYALVLRSLGVPFQVVNVGAAFGLHVPREHANAALAELESYHEENVDWPPRVPPAKIRATGKYSAIAFGVAITVMHVFIMYGPVGRAWRSAGKVDAAKIMAEALRLEISAEPELAKEKYQEAQTAGADARICSDGLHACSARLQQWSDITQTASDELQMALEASRADQPILNCEGLGRFVLGFLKDPEQKMEGDETSHH